MFIRPTDGRITSPFGYRTHPISGQRQSFHQGIDIAKVGNVSVVAAAAGTVTRVGPLGTYGNVVMIVHNVGGKTYETNYAHLHSYVVKVGDKVKQGQRIGRMGTTGNSTGQHLHFEIHVGRWATGQPNAVDPAKYVNFGSTSPKLGDVGPHVLDLQKNLNKLGYKLAEDSSFGPSVDKAVKDLQGKNKLVKDGQAGPATQKVVNAKIKALKPVTPKGKTLHLPKTASSWRVYPTNKTPIKANALKTKLNPKKFGGLSYTIIGNPQKDVYTIQTQQLGKVNIYAGPDTSAVIK